MEPQYMIIGEAAGVAAAIAIREGKDLQDIETQQLREELRRRGAVMEYREPITSPAFFHNLWQKYQPSAAKKAELP